MARLPMPKKTPVPKSRAQAVPAKTPPVAKGATSKPAPTSPTGKGAPALDRTEALRLYRQMLLIRRFEERAQQIYVEGKIGGFLHLYIGQEAIACGIMSLLHKDDYFLGAYRDHGYTLARGADPKPLMAELMGRSTGISRGKGGSMHFYDVPNGNFGGDGIVGGHIPIAAGMGYAIRLRGSEQCVVCFFGDGAINEGAFHEALNVASLWDLPVVFVVENNMYGMGTSVERASAVTSLHERGAAYGMVHLPCDGMDIFKVRDTFADAFVRARKDKKPTFIEVITYRYRGHSMSDPGKYRSKEEVEKWQEKDPIARLGVFLLDKKFAKPADLEAIDKDVNLEVDDCIKFSEESAWPPAEYMYEDIYVKTPTLNWRAVEKDPAWERSLPDDRVPVAYPAWGAGGGSSKGAK
jgi:pyruvate dehydrogenase E1 component alpha subunit